MSDGDVVVAVDCDLHRIHAWCSVCGMVCTGLPYMDAIITHSRAHEMGGISGVLAQTPMFLFEIASPVSSKRGGESSAIMYNLTKWIIFNSAIGAYLDRFLQGELLVSPSNKWTKGYDVKTRHAMAKATAKNKDLRECEAMLWMYKQNPKAWTTLGAYLVDL